MLRELTDKLRQDGVTLITKDWEKGIPTDLMCVIPLSGGKDSQATLKLAIDTFGKRNVIAVFCDTGFEHPITYAHVDNCRKLYQVPVLQLGATGKDVQKLCLSKQRMPSSQTRFCTSELKLRPSKYLYKHLSLLLGHGFEVWCGMRSAESKDRAARYADVMSTEVYDLNDISPKAYPKYLGKQGVTMRLPILDWTTEAVLEFLNGEENPLYREGFQRVGCFLCLAAGDGHKIQAFNYDETGRKHYMIAKSIEKASGIPLFKTKKGSQFDMSGNGCSFCSI